MSPKKGSPVLVHLNRFTGWSATFTISYMENVYSAEQFTISSILPDLDLELEVAERVVLEDTM